MHSADFSLLAALSNSTLSYLWKIFFQAKPEICLSSWRSSLSWLISTSCSSKDTSRSCTVICGAIISCQPVLEVQASSVHPKKCCLHCSAAVVWVQINHEHNIVLQKGVTFLKQFSCKNLHSIPWDQQRGKGPPKVHIQNLFGSRRWLKLTNVTQNERQDNRGKAQPIVMQVHPGSQKDEKDDEHEQSTHMENPSQNSVLSVDAWVQCNLQFLLI